VNYKLVKKLVQLFMKIKKICVFFKNIVFTFAEEALVFVFADLLIIPSFVFMNGKMHSLIF